MSEDRFKEILGKTLEYEFSGFDSAPEHKFSRKHRRAMKRIFAEYRKNVRSPLRETAQASPEPAAGRRTTVRSLKQRVLTAAVIIILLTFLTGWVVIYRSRAFHGTVYPDNTHIFAVDTEGCPETIEYEYALAFVPEGFELAEKGVSLTDVCILYMNNTTGQLIVFQQWVKSHYMPHIDTENGILNEVDINGKAGLYVDFGDSSWENSLVIWDNGDYIIEIDANLDKKSIINLAKINKF